MYKKNFIHFLGIALLSLFSQKTICQDTVRYVGKTLVNVDYHHGQLPLAVGVHNYQTFRANREHPEWAGGSSWTYNHAPMLAYWNNTFFLEFLSDPVGEHIPPGQTFLQTSSNGKDWTNPVVLFPPHKIPDGWTKEGYKGVAKDLYAVMHQRMGFYVSKKNRLLALAYYGIALDAKDDPNDGKGIGRVVREIYKDGSFGPIHFIRPNRTWDLKQSPYTMFTQSKDKGFIEACNELLATPLMMQQWVEEADRDDELIPLKKEVKAFSFYHLPNKNVVGLWKHALTSISKDEGKTWEYSPLRAPGFVNSNAKIWGQKLPNGQYATVYNPSEFRWPLGISVSDNGLDYKNLLLVTGEISTMRYGGNYKSYGPQYVRGIIEGNGTPPDGNMWLTYSMNKEDIWVSKVPVPVASEVYGSINETFDKMPEGKELELWNIYSPLWAKVGIEKAPDGTKALTLHDKDPFDFAKAERVIPEATKTTITFTIIPAQNNKGLLHIEFQDEKGTPAARLIFDSDSTLKAKVGYRNSGVQAYETGKSYEIRVELDRYKRMYDIYINGQKKGTRLQFAPVASFRRVVFRTGEVRRFPNADTPTDQDFDVPKAGEQAPEAIFYIKNFIVK
ncbi:six-hairpin glycosidase [Flectobacillus sp. DC10W]|uniref:Six-hairpin glycosidase n=1 Tax=Flectobacillus longus TaxID=2984207 RepID=A0ABT6YPP9_9BACT|nr:six-hairpin glycosidase [Flectobacillus longus]MDI9865564.1 six-hairpin glycosidase [Flectobacillus longus]